MHEYTHTTAAQMHVCVSELPVYAPPGPTPSLLPLFVTRRTHAHVGWCFNYGYAFAVTIRIH